MGIDAFQLVRTAKITIQLTPKRIISPLTWSLQLQIRRFKQQQQEGRGINEPSEILKIQRFRNEFAFFF